MAERIVSVADAQAGDLIQRMHKRGTERVPAHPMFTETIIAAGPKRFEVAKAMYQAARAETPKKMPESLDELNPRTQQLYLNRAKAAIAVTGEPKPAGAAGDVDLLADLAEHLAFRLNHPGQFWDGVRGVLERYAELVGDDRVSDEVRAAMRI